MTSSNKVLTISIGFLTTLLIIVEAGHHGSSDELATLIAAGLITLLLKQGSSTRSSLSLAKHAHGFMLPHALSLETFAHPRNIGFGFHAFNFAPMFGGLRYHLATLDHMPIPGAEFNKGMDFNVPFARNYGLYPPLPPLPALPDMFTNNKQSRVNNHFDIVRNILQRERENNPPLNVEVQNEQPHFNPENRDFFNFDQEEKPQPEGRKQRVN